MRTKKVKLLVFENYLTTIRNGVGTKMFRNLFVEIDGRKTDAAKNGLLSCSLFASTVLVIFKLINEIHATVRSTIIDMEDLGWYKIRKPRIGAILLWEKKDDHKHLGFYMSARKAISNNSQNRLPSWHHWTFGIKNGRPVRKVEAIYWHKRLDEK